MIIEITAMKRDDKVYLMEILRNTTEFKPEELFVAEEVIDSYLNENGKSGYYVLVAKCDSKVMGYVCYGPTPLTDGTWDIYWIAVMTESRGQGIGKGLINEAEAAIRKADGRLILVETSSTPAYENTRRFYLSLGYEIIADIPEFYSTDDDKLIFEKRYK